METKEKVQDQLHQKSDHLNIRICKSSQPRFRKEAWPERSLMNPQYSIFISEGRVLTCYNHSVLQPAASRRFQGLQYQMMTLEVRVHVTRASAESKRLPQTSPETRTRLKPTLTDILPAAKLSGPPGGRIRQRGLTPRAGPSCSSRAVITVTHGLKETDAGVSLNATRSTLQVEE